MLQEVWEVDHPPLATIEEPSTLENQGAPAEHHDVFLLEARHSEPVQQAPRWVVQGPCAK